MRDIDLVCFYYKGQDNIIYIRDGMIYRCIAVCNMQDSDTGIKKSCNVSIYRVSQYITIIGCTDLNNMTNILIILKVQVRLLS